MTFLPGMKEKQCGRQMRPLAFEVDFIKVARLDFFVGVYLSLLSINYVGMSKYIGKRLPPLYYIKMKISYDLGFIAIGVAMAT